MIKRYSITLIDITTGDCLIDEYRSYTARKPFWTFVEHCTKKCLKSDLLEKDSLYHLTVSRAEKTAVVAFTSCGHIIHECEYKRKTDE
jgi:hypothetical protein